MMWQEQIDIIQPIENTTYVGLFLVFVQACPYIVYLF